MKDQCLGRMVPVRSVTSLGRMVLVRSVTSVWGGWCWCAVQRLVMHKWGVHKNK